ncbi:MAG: N-acyl-L-amino acid amidohydrolase [Bacteroidetes bacterium 4572_77]|nr:MAG: N-acyl-L-amino acid amidohydrolase [Bacteroidetes bacterium 4572_77]
MDVKTKILQISEKWLLKVKEYREWFHKYPELAFQEYKTAEYIIQFLEEQKIPYEKGVAKTGIVGLIKGKNPTKKILALRADMDALEILEENQVPYKSINQGIMHACGHDVHMASLMGTIAILNEIKDDFEGSIKFIFQPSEEQYPGGAKVMIEEGVLENPKPASIFGQHVFPELEQGKVGFRAGKYMASTDEVYLKVIGKGGHGGIPQHVIDPVLIASHIIIGLQQLVSRRANPTTPTVLSFGRFIAQGQTNVIPNEVSIAGTMRTFDEKWRKSMHKEIKKLAQGLAQSMGGDCEVKIAHGYPFVYNNEELTQKAKKAAIELLGKDKVVDLDMRMTAEDFSFYSQVIPGCFYRLGTSNAKKGLTSNLHSPTFDADYNSFKTGMALMAWLAVCELKQGD